jgi:hypothetical protein
VALLRSPEAWIAERESIRVKRDAGLPRPWTRDPVLDRFRFCNVRREDDKVSRWLTRFWYAGASRDDYWLGRILLARWVNNIPTLERLAEANLHVAWSVTAWESAKVNYNTRAYCLPVPVVKNVGGRAGLLELMPRVLPVAWPKAPTIQACYEAITSVHGLGSFWGGQLALDALMAYGGLADEDDFCSPGPGSKKGLKLIAMDGTFVECARRLRDQWNKKLDGKLGFLLRALDVEHVLCEWNKYNYLKERV